MCPVGSMTSAAEPAFLPALSEVYSLVGVAGGGGSSGGLCWEGRLGFGQFEGDCSLIRTRWSIRASV